VNSETARSNHIRMGYSDENIQVIYNGIDVSEFKPNKDAREKIRRELEIDEDELLVGMAARFNPQKDHLNFIRAARIINDRNPDVRFILCGRGVDGNNKQITTWIDENGLKDKISLLGEKRNLASLYNAWDINVLSSCGESFPNVIAEAMSCGVPCAATDVGDSAMIIGDTGMVVPPGDSASLAGAVLKLLKNEKLRQSLGKKARERIIDLFSLQNISEQYEKLLDDEMKNK
jgi:glycosyltransferase involved in cell wall biosynthesis